MWCDSFDHLQRACDSNTEALQNGIVLLKEEELIQRSGVAIWKRALELEAWTSYERGHLEVMAMKQWHMGQI